MSNVRPHDGAAIKGVLFFGGYDPDYPRNAIIRKGLTRCGFPVSECRVDARLKVHLRYPALLWRFARMRDRSPVLFVPEFRHKDVPLAWALARFGGKRVVFDPLVSRYETRVLDRADFARGSVQSRHNRNLDVVSFRLVDLVLSDTEAHARFYAEEFGVPSSKIRVVPVGFDEDIFKSAPLPGDRALRTVLFYGSYLPLHGVETIVSAAKLLRDRPVRFMLVGEGQTYPDVRKLAAGLPEGFLDFRPAVSPADIARIMADVDIALGVFGTSPKVGMVVPNKVFQALATGRPLITADTPAIRELFTNGVHLLTVPPGDAGALAKAVELLAGNAALRTTLAEAGGTLVRERFNSGRVAARLAAILGEEGFL